MSGVNVDGKALNEHRAGASQWKFEKCQAPVMLVLWIFED